MTQYIALIEYGGHNKPRISYHAVVPSRAAADKWASATLQEHGLEHVEVYIAEVVYFSYTVNNYKEG